MSFVNPKSQGYREKAHLNWMGGPSYEVTGPLRNLEIAAASCFFGEPMYYHGQKGDRPRRTIASVAGEAARLSNTQLSHLEKMLGESNPQRAGWRRMDPAAMMESAIDSALAQDVEQTLQVAARLRNDSFIRTTPQIIMVRAANFPAQKETGLVRKYGRLIMQRGDEPATQLAYQLGKYGKPIPNSLKRAWADYLSGRNEYSLSKYRMEARQVKTVDVVNLVSGGKANRSMGNALSTNVNELMRGNLKTTGETWEAIISKEGSTKAAWLKAIEVMGHMALLRNLRNLVKNGVPDSAYRSRLLAGVERGKQLPFRYYSAFRALQEAGGPPGLLDAVEECLAISVEKRMPSFSGKVMSLCDNSGSAQGATTSSMGTMQVSTIANLTGILAGQASEEGYVGIFGDGLKTWGVRKRSSVFDQLQLLDRAARTIGGETEHGIWLFWDKAIKDKEHWDLVFVFSDMQAGHGGLYGVGSPYPVWPGGHRWTSAHYIDVPKLISEYRSKVNPKVQVVLCQVAGYQDTIVPDAYPGTYIIGGWGTGIFDFTKRMTEIYQ